MSPPPRSTRGQVGRLVISTPGARNHPWPLTVGDATPRFPVVNASGDRAAIPLLLFSPATGRDARRRVLDRLATCADDSQAHVLGLPGDHPKIAE